MTRDGEAPLALSTVYRSLEALQALGVLTHTHVDSRVPSYHLVSHATHIHLVCRGCGWVGEVPAGEGGALVARIDTLAGFRADLTHSALHGLCAACATDADTAPAAGSVSPPATAPTHDPQHPLTPKDSSS